MPSYGRSFLKEEEKDKYSRRLSHFLEDYCYRNKVTHNQAAEKLGISSNKFSQLKSGGEQGRYLSSLDYLKSLANLEGMTLTEFIAYLDGDTQQARPNYSWQDMIYKALEVVSIVTRRKFAEACARVAGDSERTEVMLRAATAMETKNIEAVKALVEGLEKL